MYCVDFADMCRYFADIADMCRYFADFLQSEYHCQHQIDVLTSTKVLLPDVLYCDSAMFYFMEVGQRSCVDLDAQRQVYIRLGVKTPLPQYRCHIEQLPAVSVQCHIFAAI